MIILRRLSKTKVLLFMAGLGVAMIIASALIGGDPTDEARTSGIGRPVAGLPGVGDASRPDATFPYEALPSDSTAADDGRPPDAPLTAEVSGCTPDGLYQEDVTVPDNTFLKMSEPFTKTWRILNTGTCGWGSGYSLHFVAGTHMGGPDAVSVAETPPGGSVEVSVALVAPADRGAYRGDWQMRSDEGVPFGSLLYLQIIVYDPSQQ